MSEPFLLSRDFIRHEPITVRMVSPVGSRLVQYVLTTRFVRREGVILEITPPVGAHHPLRLGDKVELRVKLPFQDEAVMLEGNITRLVPLARDANGKLLTAVGVKFTKLSSASLQALEAHDLSVRMKEGIERSPRISVRFPVELLGMDVMSVLIARDLSMSGMFVGGKAKFSTGKALDLRFKLPFQKREVSLRGKVVWAGPKKVLGELEPCPGFGLKFVEVSPTARVTIAAYYARNTVIP